MSSSRKAFVAVASAATLALAAGAVLAQSTPFTGIGRPATPKEVAAWDIDVRPDFKGLPKGSGSVAKGQDVWEAKCASCHGIFGESNEVFSPLVGGTTQDDVKTGRVARLTDPGYPGRTTLMKVSTVSTLWDYIHRAMPWTSPKSLTVEEVYAVTAFLLNLGGVVPDNFTLSDANIAEAQKRLPNRSGMTTDHGLWPGRGMGNGGKPDVKALACMDNCATEPTVASFLPDHARGSHGNLAEQNRIVGPQHGANTAAGAAASAAPTPAATAVPAGKAADASAQALARQYNCLTCHGVENKVVGPALRDVARKYAARADAAEYFARKISEGGSGIWGAIPMPAQTVPATDLKSLAQWLASGAP
jgi:S-disulfanyl-L-cysteine oxidoreductase SoxD